MARLLQEAMRKTYRDPEFFKEYTKLAGLKAEPQMPEELEQTVKERSKDDWHFRSPQCYKVDDSEEAGNHG
jgi:hypothetical protein